jgi:hypothetical protein
MEIVNTPKYHYLFKELPYFDIKLNSDYIYKIPFFTTYVNRFMIDKEMFNYFLEGNIHNIITLQIMYLDGCIQPYYILAAIFAKNRNFYVEFMKFKFIIRNYKISMAFLKKGLLLSYRAIKLLEYVCNDTHSFFKFIELRGGRSYIDVRDELILNSEKISKVNICSDLSIKKISDVRFYYNIF